MFGGSLPEFWVRMVEETSPSISGLFAQCHPKLPFTTGLQLEYEVILGAWTCTSADRCSPSGLLGFAGHPVCAPGLPHGCQHCIIRWFSLGPRECLRWSLMPSSVVFGNSKQWNYCVCFPWEITFCFRISLHINLYSKTVFHNIDEKEVRLSQSVLGRNK